MLIGAIISMLLAVTAYTTAVFSERKAGIIKKQHIIIFCIGLIFDTTGTSLMSIISDGFDFDIHGITGAVALVLMLVHVVWAIWVYFKGSERAKKSFHHFSFYVWLIWMIPFVSGMIMNMK